MQFFPFNFLYSTYILFVNLLTKFRLLDQRYFKVSTCLSLLYTLQKPSGYYVSGKLLTNFVSPSLYHRALCHLQRAQAKDSDIASPVWVWNKNKQKLKAWWNSTSSVETSQFVRRCFLSEVSPRSPLSLTSLTCLLYTCFVLMHVTFENGMYTYNARVQCCLLFFV